MKNITSWAKALREGHKNRMDVYKNGQLIATVTSFKEAKAIVTKYQEAKNV